MKEPESVNFRVVASLDRKRLGQELRVGTMLIRGVFDKEASRKPLAFAARVGTAENAGAEACCAAAKVCNLARSEEFAAVYRYCAQFAPTI